MNSRELVAYQFKIQSSQSIGFNKVKFGIDEKGRPFIQFFVENTAKNITYLNQVYTKALYWNEKVQKPTRYKDSFQQIHVTGNYAITEAIDNLLNDSRYENHSNKACKEELRRFEDQIKLRQHKTIIHSKKSRSIDD